MTSATELDTLVDPITSTTITYDWDAASQLIEVAYGTGSAPTRTLVWDDLGQLVEDTLTDTTPTTVASFTYGYDDDSNVVSVDVDLGGNALDGLHQYGYDHAGRLTSWTDPDQTTITYGWDGASNRTSAGTDSFTYDQRNRLVASPDGTHTHEARGTLASVGTTTYDFDALGRLTDADGTAYSYDSLDRIAERDSVAFTYNSPGRHPVSDGGHVWSRSPGGRLVAQDDGTNQRLVGLNRHGDLTYLFTTAGAVTDTVVYDPFGDPAATTGTGGSTLGFQGDYTDPHSTQVWMGARWYAPAHAVFTSRDTLQGELTTPVSLNRYTYAAANPLLYWDPDGRQAALIDDPLGGLSRTRSRESEPERLRRLSGTTQSSTAFSSATRTETERLLRSPYAQPPRVTTASDQAARAVEVAEDRNLVVYKGGTKGRRTSDEPRADQLADLLDRPVTALEWGKHRPRSVINLGDSMPVWPVPSARTLLRDCHRPIAPNCYGPEDDAFDYALQLLKEVRDSPTGRIDIIAGSYSALELSIVFEKYPLVKKYVDNVGLLSPTQVRVDAFEGVNVHVVYHEGDRVQRSPRSDFGVPFPGRLGHAADIPGATVRTTNINVNDWNPFTTYNRRHDGWFMGGQVGANLRDELGRMMRELGW